jgi:hypothetical protein
MASSGKKFPSRNTPRLRSTRASDAQLLNLLPAQADRFWRAATLACIFHEGFASQVKHAG